MPMSTQLPEAMWYRFGFLQFKLAYIVVCSYKSELLGTNSKGVLADLREELLTSHVHLMPLHCVLVQYHLRCFFFFTWRHFQEAESSSTSFFNIRISNIDWSCSTNMLSHASSVIVLSVWWLMSPPIWSGLKYLNSYWMDKHDILYRRSCSPEDES